MSHTVLSLAVLDALLFAAAGATGIAFADPQHPGSEALFAPHLFLSIAATLLACFVHSLAMFYFIGTGRDIKEGCRSLPAEQAAAFVGRTRAFKARVFPAATYSTGLLMAAAILGGGVHTGALPAWVHWGLAGAGFAWSLQAFRLEVRAMAENRALIDEVGRALDARGPGLSPGPAPR